jgi:nucleosome binding factor SPN SPT16 subunit
LRAADRVLHVGGNVVADVEVVHRAVGRYEARHQQEVDLVFGNAQALLLHFFGQQGRGQLHLVLHLHLGNVGVGALIEASA